MFCTTNRRRLAAPMARMNQIVATGMAACVLTIASTTIALAEQPGIMCVQNQLSALGFNLGTPDGTIGTKTRNAAEEYRAWMSGGAGEAGWSQPPLTALNGEFWCQELGKAHPEIARFAVATPGPRYELMAGELEASFDVPVSGTISNWKLHFEFKTQCENDHHIELVSPTGQVLVVMERGLNRCSGRSTIFTGDNTDEGGAFVGTAALGTWKIRFQDLDANAYTGALTSVRMVLGVDTGEGTTKYVVRLNKLPKNVPNPD